MASQDDVVPVPNMKVAQHQFTLSTPTLAHLHAETADSFLKVIEEEGTSVWKIISWIEPWVYEYTPAEMAPYLKLVLAQTPSVLPSSSQSSSKALLEKLEAKNKTRIEEIDAQLAEAEKQEGETEISDALRAKANYLTKIGEKVRPLEFSRYLYLDADCVTGVALL